MAGGGRQVEAGRGTGRGRGTPGPRAGAGGSAAWKRRSARDPELGKWGSRAPDPGQGEGGGSPNPGYRDRDRETWEAGNAPGGRLAGRAWGARGSHRCTEAHGRPLEPSAGRGGKGAAASQAVRLVVPEGAKRSQIRGRDRCWKDHETGQASARPRCMGVQGLPRENPTEESIRTGFVGTHYLFPPAERSGHFFTNFCTCPLGSLALWANTPENIIFGLQVERNRAGLRRARSLLQVAQGPQAPRAR